MADIYCISCGEPWDTYTLHEEAETRGGEGDRRRYEKILRDVTRDFRRRGCAALPAIGGTSCQPAESPAMQRTADVAAAVYEMLGDEEISGAAAFTIEDLL